MKTRILNEEQKQSELNSPFYYDGHLRYVHGEHGDADNYLYSYEWETFEDVEKDAEEYGFKIGIIHRRNGADFWKLEAEDVCEGIDWESKEDYFTYDKRELEKHLKEAIEYNDDDRREDIEEILEKYKEWLDDGGLLYKKEGHQLNYDNVNKVDRWDLSYSEDIHNWKVVLIPENIEIEEEDED